MATAHTTRDQFLKAATALFGRYDLIHRRTLITDEDTLVMEGLLEPGMTPIVDVLWARAQLEGFPNGGGMTLADTLRS